MSRPLRIGPDLDENSRFHRQQLIDWWDQGLLARTRVLLIGAGALGNEILKNLALVGVGKVVVVDMDLIEHSNLARAVLFRENDIGRSKAEVACRRVVEIFPGALARPLVVNCLHDLGLGVFRWADVVMCGLDNREARVATNRACQLVGTPWIDGAIERLDGVARVFLPDTGACYECTMSEVDWQALEARRSCALLSREQMEDGRTPTTATSSSIIAGFQCQELLKIVHGQPVEGGTGVVVNGQMNDVYRVSYPRKADCMVHETLEEIVDLPAGAADVTVGDLLARAESDLGCGVFLELSREIIQHLECPSCGDVEEFFRPLGAIGMSQARCGSCAEQRFPLLMHSLEVTWKRPEMTLGELGLPPFDLVIARQGEVARGYILDGDRAAVLGDLADTGSAAAGGIHESD